MLSLLKETGAGSFERQDIIGGAVAGKILVTGRDVNIRTILEFRLEQEGYTVLVSESSAQALEHAWTEQPDLIILDLAEPHEDGLEFLKQVRTRPESADVPIFVLSTYRREELEGNGRQLQDVAFLLKPFSPRELVAEVHRTITSGLGDMYDPGRPRPA